MSDTAPLLDINAVIARVNCGKRTLWRWVSTGEFPPPDVSRGRKFRRWYQSTVDGWIDRGSPIPINRQSGMEAAHGMVGKTR